MLKERKQLWYTLSLQNGLCRWVVYQIIFLPTLVKAIFIVAHMLTNRVTIKYKDKA